MRSTDPIATAEVTVYGALWCGHCTRLKAQLDHAGITYHAIDVDAQPETLEFLASLNGGDWLIPTVVLSNGHTLINPNVVEVRRALDTW